MPSDFTESVIAEFRANKGRVGGELASTPILLIHHLGVRTRAERVTPVAYSSLPDGRLVIAASNGGSPTHPAWYHNLKAHPTIEVELSTETFTALAQEVTGAAHAELWPKLIAASPDVGRVSSQDNATNPPIHAHQAHILSSAPNDG